MKQTSNVITFSAPVDLMAAATGQPQSFKTNAYYGGMLRLNGFSLPVVVDLKGLERDSTIVANLDHDPAQRVGHVEEMVNDGRTLQLAGIVSATGAAAQEFISNSKNKFPWSASIEARPTEQMEFIAAGQTVSVNGQTFAGPLLVARKSTLYGVAFLSKGADPHARAMLASKGKDMSFEDWVKSLGLDPTTVGDDQKAKLQEAYDALNGTVAASMQRGDLTIEAEMKRIQRIDDLTDWDSRSSQYQTVQDLRAAAISGKISEDRLRRGVLNALRADYPKGPAIHASRVEATGQVIEAAFSQSIGLPNIEKHYSDQTLQAAHTHFRGRIGIQQMLIMAAADAGYRCQPGEQIHQGNLRQILAYALPPEGPQRIHAAGSTTLSLPGIFSNVANKELLEGWKEEDQTWREIAAIKSVNDFKQATSYRLLDNSEYEEVSPDGRIKHGTLGEESYTRQVKTYAKMFGLTRVDILNDDAGAFEDLRARLGGGGSKKFNRLFWTRFLANSGFFTNARGNYIEGATTNLGLDGVGLELGLKAFRELRTPEADGSKRVGGKAEILLVPGELGFIAKSLYVSTTVNTGGASSVDSMPNANVYVGEYKPVICDFLSDPDYSGSSDKAYYLFRKPTAGAPVAVSFLNGQQSPTVETADADFDQLAILFRGFHDFGIDFAEYLAGVKVKGEA